MDSVLHEFSSAFRKKVADRIAVLSGEVQPVGLYEPVRWALSAHGKMLRPVLLLTVCEAVGGRADDALDAAAALEMVHIFSLVHDDIMDN
ncbi:MAG: polyprenyl synthetase family protein, partial [candidate division KSB1 bacterium]|nr:polyprenyl synthetase family protein [candidate division KSB1 bacterium]